MRMILLNFLILMIILRLSWRLLNLNRNWRFFCPSWWLIILISKFTLFLWRGRSIYAGNSLIMNDFIFSLLLNFCFFILRMRYFRRLLRNNTCISFSDFSSWASIHLPRIGDASRIILLAWHLFIFTFLLRWCLEQTWPSFDLLLIASLVQITSCSLSWPSTRASDFLLGDFLFKLFLLGLLERLRIALLPCTFLGRHYLK